MTTHHTQQRGKKIRRKIFKKYSGKIDENKYFTCFKLLQSRGSENKNMALIRTGCN